MKLRVVIDNEERIIDWSDQSAEQVYWIWTEGNYSCDCNRSLVLKRKELPCGDTLFLKFLEIIYQSGKTFVVIDYESKEQADLP